MGRNDMEKMKEMVEEKTCKYKEVVVKE